jgi:membrane-associated phospholipid phosphatase
MQPLLDLDERLFLAVNGLGNPTLDPILVAVTWLGHGLVLAAVVLGPMALFDRVTLRRRFAAIVLSVAVGALAVEGVKSAVDRSRPAARFAAAEARGEVEVCMPDQQLHERSFPSGHTQAAFGAAAWVLFLYGARRGALALALAAAVGFSRVYLGVHFPLDVVAGAAFGIGFSWAGRTFERRRSPYSVSNRSAGTLHTGHRSGSDPSET